MSRAVERSPYEQRALEIVRSAHALISNTHVVYKSGRHANIYVNKDLVYQQTNEAERLGRYLAAEIKKYEVEVIIGPAVAGALLAQWVAHAMNRHKQPAVLFGYADKYENEFVLKRGYESMVRNKKVAIIEDVMTTGGSVRGVINAIKKEGGIPTVAGVLFNRGSVTAHDIGIPSLHSLIQLNLPTWEASECPLCERGVAINTSLGHGHSLTA